MYVDAAVEVGIMQRRSAALSEFAEKYNEDSDLQERASLAPRDVFGEHGIEIPPEMDVNIVQNSPDTFHIVFPPDPNMALEDEQLAVVAGGGKSASTVASAGTASSASSVPSCVGTASSAGTVGSAGTAS